MNSLLILAFLALADPEPMTLKVRLDGVPPASAGEAELILWDPSDGKEVARRKVPVPWRGEWNVERPLSGLRLELDSADYWSAPALVGEKSDAVNLTLFPRGEIVFSEEAAPPPAGSSTPGPEIFQLEVSSVPLPRGKDPLRRTPLACRREGERFRCPAPALALDLRLEKDEHVPRYIFGARVERGKTLDLGKIRFEKGASISGFVTAEEGEPQGAEIDVNVAGRFSPAEGQRQELRKLAAVANERGFFQVLGVAPGGYRIEATRKGLTKTELWPVEVLAGQETSLAQPLHLTRAAELELHVSPPLGPLGRPWKVTLILDRLDGGTETFEGEADPSGVWRRPDLPPGSCLVHVANPDGEKTGAGDDSIWAMQMLDLAPGHQPLYVDIPSIAVEGTLKAGDEPVAARLIFGGFHGAPHVTLRSDEEGRFAGLLPRAGEWDLDADVGGQLRTLPAVEVEPRGGKPARLDIQLPDTRFYGRVVHKGKGVAGASLWGQGKEAGKSARFDLDTDGEGKFDLKGLSAGSYSVIASSAALKVVSPRLGFDIQEGVDSPPVEIELEELLRVEGQVLANGAPTPNAGFGLYLQARAGNDSRPGQSDSLGTVQLLVPESTREIALVIAAPGFAWQVLSLKPGGEPPAFRPFVAEVGQNGGALRLTAGSLRQSWLYSNGIGVPLLLVKDTLRSTGYLTDQGATWVLANAAPSHYRLCQADRCTEGLLTSGGLTLDLGSLKGNEPTTSAKSSK